MSYERRPDRRPGGRSGGGRPDRGPRERGFGGDRPPRDRGFGGDRPPRDSGGFSGDRPPQRGGRYGPRPDEGGMSIRLDPRRLAALKLLAAEAGMRPGELVTAWVEERLDAARAGRPAPAAGGPPQRELAALAARVDELARRLDEMANALVPEPAPTAESSSAEPEAPPAKRRGRPRREAAQPQPASTQEGEAATTTTGARVPLHEEIAAVIGERGPLTAAEIASAIAERGRYSAPRSNRPLDAATVNSRVSNPAYRSRFTRTDGRIGLA